MLSSNLIIQYHDFNPSDYTKVYIESVINEIHSELPDGSRVKATFTKRDNLYKGMLNVGSYSGPFFAVATSDDFKQVLVKLVDQMRRRLEKWKSKKHSKKSIKHLAEDENKVSGVA